MKPTFDNLESFYHSPVKTLDIGTSFNSSSQTFNSLPSFQSKDYFSPFNPVFIHRLSRSEIFKKRQILLARDGLFDLVSFLLKHPSPPKGFQSVLLFPESFTSFIPAPWKEVSLSYHYRPRKAFNPKASGGLMGVGHVCLDALDFNQVDLFLSKLKKKNTKSFLLIDENVPDYSKWIVDYQSANLKLKQSFFAKIPPDINFLGLRQLTGLNFDSTWSFINIDKDYLIYDRWSDHYFGSLGVFKNQEIVSLPLSVTKFAINAFEDIVISHWNSSENHFNELYLEYKLLNIKLDGFHSAFREKIKALKL